MIKKIEKCYVLETKYWEIKYKFLFLNFYLYKHSDKNIFSLYRKFKKNKRMYKPTITKIVIGRKKFKEEYNNNKYLVPYDYEIDTNVEDSYTKIIQMDIR
jgi:hypothetical protein